MKNEKLNKQMNFGYDVESTAKPSKIHPKKKKSELVNVLFHTQ